MAWYNISSNLSGLGNFVNATGSALSTQVGDIMGINFIGLMFLVPMWFIVFIPLYSRSNVYAAFTGASFIVFIASIVLVAMQIINPVGIWLTLFITMGGTIIYYFVSRP